MRSRLGNETPPEPFWLIHNYRRLLTHKGA
jgi:hypothetical protein